MRTKIAARFVVGYEGGDHVVYRDGEVVYEDDRIVHVGYGFAGTVDTTVEAGDAVVSPGFIDLNALADIDHGILDTFQGPQLALGLQWSEDYFRNRRHELFSPEDERFQRRYALIQLLLNGITTAMPIAAETYRAWCETFEQFADVARIAGELGIRMYLGPAYRSGINVVRADGSRDVLWDYALGEDGLQQAVRFVRDFDGEFDGRIRGAFLPCRIETVTLDLLRETKRHADELGCPIKLHAAQGLPELALIQPGTVSARSSCSARSGSWGRTWRSRTSGTSAGTTGSRRAARMSWRFSEIPGRRSCTARFRAPGTLARWTPWRATCEAG
jgi:cytosine/adenosine deaminase-related metal-dependent hydrolase